MITDDWYISKFCSKQRLPELISFDEAVLTSTGLVKSLSIWVVTVPQVNSDRLVNTGQMKNTNK